MTTRTVTTQVELDQALADAATTIYIDSPEGVWITLSSHVVAWGSSHVEARGSAHVEARGSAHVVAWDSAHVVAWDSAHVVARGSAHVVAWGSSHVEAWGSSHVVAWDSSHVEAWGSSHVEAWGSSHVEAGSHVAVHLHSQRVTLAGGVLIDMTAIDRTDAGQWVAVHGITVTDGTLVLYKALDADLRAGQAYRPTVYGVGTTVVAEDWRDDTECGGGLHLSPSPSCARSYRPDAARYVAVAVAVADIRPIPGGTPKVKVPRCNVLHEVDVYGRALAVSA